MEQQKSVPIGESLTYGWSIMKQHLGFFILLLIVLLIADYTPSFLLNIGGDSLLMIFLIQLVGLVWGTLLKLGMIHISLRFLDGQKPTIGELFGQSALLGQGILLSILYGLIVLGGTLLFIIPGIVWALKYSQAFYLLVDKKITATEALKMSGSLMNGAKLEFFGFGIVAGFVVLAGLLALVLGLFAAIPTVMIAYAYVYRHLLKSTPIIATTQNTVNDVMDAPKQS